jgi:hypothetical protein
MYMWLKYVYVDKIVYSSGNVNSSDFSLEYYKANKGIVYQSIQSIQTMIIQNIFIVYTDYDNTEHACNIF